MKALYEIFQVFAMWSPTIALSVIYSHFYMSFKTTIQIKQAGPTILSCAVVLSKVTVDDYVIIEVGD